MPAPLFAQALGAQYNLDAPGFVLVAIAVAVTIGIAAAGAVLYAALRRKPPIEVEIEGKIAAAIKTLDAKVEKRIDDLAGEVHRLNTERRVTIGNLFGKLDEQRSEFDKKLGATNSTMSKGFEDVHRVLGRIEGRLSRS